MLSPKNHIVLLPQDREIMDITGMSEEQYRWFVKQAVLYSKVKPGEPTAFLNFVIPLVIGIALQAASALLSPRQAPQQQRRAKDQERIGGQDLVSGERFAPTSGFDSVQNVVELGSTIPLVYANRREVPVGSGNYYGGVRVNTNLLWSQLLSTGAGQLLRSIFLIGEGTIPQPDPEQFAIGNNLLNNFDLESNPVSRLSLYYVDGSQALLNRIRGVDNIAGRPADADDPGNAEINGGADVFQARRPGDNQWAPDFVYASRPSNQTTFGVGGFIGNNLPYRVNPDIKPQRNYIPEGASGKSTNNQSVVERQKDTRRYFGRAGVVALNGAPLLTEGRLQLNVGDTFTYSIFPFSDYDAFFSIVDGESGNESRVDTKDVAQAVASRQNSFDDLIQLGDRYLAGTAIAVCVDRTPEAFNSEVTNKPVQGGTQVDAVFEVVRPGVLDFWTEGQVNPPVDPDDEPNSFDRQITATNSTHLMRCSEGFVAVERKTQFVEVGFKSTVNMNFNGVCAWGNITYSYDTIDDLNETDNSFFTNPTYTSPETRYSCFKVAYRSKSATDFVEIDRIFAIRSLSSSPVYNSLRFEFPAEDFWELKFTPVSGFEARQDGIDPLDQRLICILDAKNNNRVSSFSRGVNIIFSGVANENISDPGIRDLLSVQILGSGNLAGDPLNGFDDEDFHVDRFARLAEFFIINEMTTSATNPEHEIVYVNTQTANDTAPDYANLAMVGLNIRSSTEINQLQQFSVYCERGIGSTNRFPDVLKDLLTNRRYGTGTILNSEQIDIQSFEAAAEFCESRFYFFDGVIEEKLNIRSWAAQTAQAFLLDFVIRNGKFALQPAIRFNEAEPITALYTAGNIIEDSFELSFIDEEERIPPRVQVRWRDEKTDQVKGNFPIIRQVTVREVDTPEDAPLEQIDATPFATSQQHAIDVAKFICRNKRLTTHTISFSTTPPESALDIGSVFKLGLETVNYDQPQNGAITSTGEVTAWPPLTDGTYDVLLWDGTNLQETTITVSDGKSSPAGSVFCLRNTTSRAGTYKTQSLSFNEEGNIQVEATFFPTNDAGISLLSEGFDTPANWVIEGEI